MPSWGTCHPAILPSFWLLKPTDTLHVGHWLPCLYWEPTFSQSLFYTTSSAGFSSTETPYTPPELLASAVITTKVTLLCQGGCAPCSTVPLSGERDALPL